MEHTARTVETYMGVKNLPKTDTMFTNKFVGSAKLTDAEWKISRRKVREVSAERLVAAVGLRFTPAGDPHRLSRPATAPLGIRQAARLNLLTDDHSPLTTVGTTCCRKRTAIAATGSAGSIACPGAATSTRRTRGASSAQGRAPRPAEFMICATRTTSSWFLSSSRAIGSRWRKFGCSSTVPGRLT